MAKVGSVNQTRKNPPKNKPRKKSPEKATSIYVIFRGFQAYDFDQGYINRICILTLQMKLVLEN